MDSYSIEFRLEGAELMPEDATRILGLTPCRTRRVGAPRGQGVWSTALWSYDGRKPLAGDSPPEWQSLAEGLAALLPSLKPLAPLLETHFGHDIRRYWWCGHFQESFDGSVTLPPKLMQELGDFGAPVILTTYFSNPAP